MRGGRIFVAHLAARSRGKEKCKMNVAGGIIKATLGVMIKKGVMQQETDNITAYRYHR
jgi:hypothetical protein